MNEEIILNVESYNPYVIGAVAYVEQLENGAKITIVDKNGTTTATVEDGKDGKSISSIVLNDNYTLTINYEDGSSTTTGSIRGATGASGVFYGEEEPIDPAINVWVDPADGDGSVLKIRDEDDQWATIESIVGEPAGFGTVTATVDANHGTPAVTVTTSGDDTAKNFAFAFSNLQPAPYDDSELQADFAVLQGQFDTAVAAVTTDTEVTDIRVGADGITDTTAGASVRRQFTDLKSEINEYVQTNVLLHLASKVISGTGYVYETILAIPASAGDVFSIQMDSITGATASSPFTINAYDSNNTKLTTFYGTGLKKTITCPANTVKVDFVLYPATTGTVTATYNNVRVFRGTEYSYLLNDEISVPSVVELAENVDAFKNKFNINPTKNVFAGGWIKAEINSDGSVNPTPLNFQTILSDYIPVEGGNKYTFGYDKYTKSGFMYVARYDSDKEFLQVSSNYIDISSRDYDIYNLAETVAYVRVMFYVGTSTSESDIVPKHFQIEKGEVKTYYINNTAINMSMLDPNEVCDRIEDFLVVPNTANDFSLDTYAHRGYSSFAPENTAPAYIYAKRKGFLYVETDIQKTSDGYYICNHDPNLNKVTNGVLPLAAENYTLAQIQAVDFGAWKGKRWVGTSVLTFEDYVKLCKQLQLKPMIELKRSDTFSEDLPYLCGFVKSLGLADYTSWIATAEQVPIIRASIPKARVGFNLSAEDIQTFNPANAAQFVEDGGLFVTCEYTGLTAEFIASCHNYGIEVSAWEVDDASTMISLSNMGVDSITSNSSIASEAILEHYLSE